MNTKRTALDAYLARSAAIRTKLERLNQLAADHFGQDPDAIHWATIGKTAENGNSGPSAPLARYP